MQEHKKPITYFLNEMWNDKALEEKEELYSISSKSLIINSPLGKSIGLQKFHDINDSWNLAFPNMQVSKIDIESFGNVVVSNWWSDAVHTNPFKGISATGKKIHYPGETIFYFERGKIVRYSCKIDMVDLYQQLGMFFKQEEYGGQAVAIKDQKLLITKLKECTDHHLTSREIQCLSLNLLGFSAKQVAMILVISYRTVETHLQKALHELHFCSKLECMEVMMEKGLLALWQDLGKILVQGYENKQKSLSGR